jgi:hypothetical protein
VLSADRRRESDAVSFIGSLLLVGSSSRSEVGSWGGGILDYQDAIARPSGTADDAAPAGRALTRLKEDACLKIGGCAR